MPQMISGLVIGFINLCLIFLLAKRLFGQRVGLLSALVYLVAPWSGFLTGFYPEYGFMLTIILLIFNVRDYWDSFILVIVFVIINEVYRGVGYFQNIGLVNSVNVLRGGSISAGYAVLSRMVENKYLFYFLGFIEKGLIYLNPLYYFTVEGRDAGFLVYPPVWSGLIIPFSFGLAQLYKKYKNKIFIICTFFLPAILSFKTVDLEKIFVVFPLICVSIALGLNQFYEERDKWLFKTLLIVSVVLFLMQFIMFATTRGYYY